MNHAIADTAIELSHTPFEGELLEPLRPKLLKNAVEELAASVAEKFMVTQADVFGKDRHKSPTAARHVVAWVMRKKWAWSYPEIGRVLGNRDHTTIMSCVKRIDGEIAKGSNVGAAAISFFNPNLRRVAGGGVLLELDQGEGAHGG